MSNCSDSLAHNGWVYEQVCLADTFKLALPLMANLHKALVITSRDYLAGILFGELNKKLKQKKGRQFNN